MASIPEIIEGIKAEAERIGLRELARKADVPYTTLRSFADRGWTSKNLAAVDRLAAVCAPIPAA